MTFCSVCLLVDCLLVLLTLATYIFVVNVQGITRHLRLKLMVLINLKLVKRMLKLIALTPLMVDMMTSQGRIGAMFVTNVLHGDDI